MLCLLCKYLRYSLRRSIFIVHHFIRTTEIEILYLANNSYLLSGRGVRILKSQLDFTLYFGISLSTSILSRFSGIYFSVAYCLKGHTTTAPHSVSGLFTIIPILYMTSDTNSCLHSSVYSILLCNIVCIVVPEI